MNVDINQTNLLKYGEIIVMTMIISQVPYILSEILNIIPKILGFIFNKCTIFIKYLFTPKEIKYKYSKYYVQEVVHRSFATAGSHREDTNSLTQEFISEELMNLLGYIANINFATNNSLNEVTYNYIVFKYVTFKIPVITKPIEIEPGLFTFYTIVNSLKEKEQGTFFSVNTENLLINVNLYSNVSKNIIDDFESRLRRECEQKKKTIDNYQTIAFYNKQGWQTYLFKTTKSFDNIFLPEKDQIFRVLDTFCNNKELYCRLGKQYYLGMLLYGLPGCGKTSLIKAIANYTKRDLYIVKLSDIKTNSDLESIFRDETVPIISHIPTISSGRYPRSYHKRIIVIEDIDVDIKLIEDRQIGFEKQKKNKEMTEKVKSTLINILDNKEKEINPTVLESLMKALERGERESQDDIRPEYKPFNLDVFLNILDGIQEQNGTIFIMTTNYPEKIDKALIRPGRCDIRVPFKRTTPEVFLEMVKYYYNEDYNEADFTTDLLEKIRDKFTASEICQLFYEHSYKMLIKYLSEFNPATWTGFNQDSGTNMNSEYLEMSNTQRSGRERYLS